jgi:hypothetical protein
MCDFTAPSDFFWFSRLPLTTDCQAFTAGGEAFFHFGFGTTSRKPPRAWISEITEIRSRYASYCESGCHEEIVFGDGIAAKGRLLPNVV